MTWVLGSDAFTGVVDYTGPAGRFGRSRDGTVLPGGGYVHTGGTWVYGDTAVEPAGRGGLGASRWKKSCPRGAARPGLLYGGENA
ncbi:hypothetical protein Q5425_34480 [Amycolatopsis sp. A133]|uniref:hypothetical protein n=1 Tax=Amycolatopsis sp. A133 TaxID=3064472 RepID=UPI0027E5BF62|nr:hypothetical protein [Amycolatopsis sp. A133]MDQ7808872.1 hypothetical protein [Amycolatopsis sp. A133]